MVREKPLIGGVKPVEQAGDAPLSAVGVAIHDEIAAERSVVLVALRAVGQKDGEMPRLRQCGQGIQLPAVEGSAYGGVVQAQQVDGRSPSASG